VATPVAALITAELPQVVLVGGVPLNVKLKVPVGLRPATLEATVAVNVTVWPTTAGFGVATSVVVVAARMDVSELEPVLVAVLASPL
jgi:hypothetical protein